MPAPTPPFRADHVGSLLRPAELLEARRKAKSGEISAQALRHVQDRAIRDAVARQEAIGLEVVTDGEFRRDWWHIDFLTGFDGVEEVAERQAMRFQGSEEQPPIVHVTGRIRRSRPVFVEHFRFLRAVAKRTPKITIPAPAMLYHRGGRPSVSRDAYPDLEPMWQDAAQAYREEIRDLYDAGCRYLQLDDVSFAYLCDPNYREAFRKRGDDPERLVHDYAKAIAMALEGKPKDLAVALHTCRGNFKSTWVAQGGYEPVADILFNEIPVDGYFLEFDSDRAGGFEPLRHAPKGKKIVLGLVTTKTAALEDRGALERRIEEAARFASPDDLCLSPQCGFSSTHHGNQLSAEDQWRKLDLVAQIAHRMWG